MLPQTVSRKSSEHLKDNLSLFPIQTGAVIFGDVTRGYYNDIGVTPPRLGILAGTTAAMVGGAVGSLLATQTAAAR